MTANGKNNKSLKMFRSINFNLAMVLSMTFAQFDLVEKYMIQKVVSEDSYKLNIKSI